MANASSVLNRLLSALSLSDPSWDTSVGSATYKIFESVAQEIANASNNATLQTYSYDVNTKFGPELDAFVNLFGLYRQLGKRSNGVVTFSVATAATSIYSIAAGTQVVVPISPTNPNVIYFITSSPAIIPIGSFSVDVPVTAVLAGTLGNVAAGSITSLGQTLVGITSVTNSSSIAGGVDPETDSQLRGRWTSTVFSNNVGTSNKYTLTALQDSNVTAANSIGPQQYYDEQLQVVSTISGTSGTNTVNFQLVAYSGQTINGVTYNTTTTVASSGFLGSTTGTTLAAGLTALVSGVYPTLVSSGFNFTVTPTGSTINGNALTITALSGSPYRLTVSGTTLSGVTTISGFTYSEKVTSNNPDVGYGTTYSGYIFPQGGELVGQYLNTSTQTVYSNNVDYLYPANPTPQLSLTILNNANNSALFIGNTVEVISEYTPACSRASTTMPSISNYADIFINGTSTYQVTEQVVFNTTQVLSGSGGPTYLNVNNYIMANGSSSIVSSGDYYIQLTQQPCINFPSQITTSNSGICDSIYIFNTTVGSGVTYPISDNYYNSGFGSGYISFSGTAISGTNFISVPNASTYIATGLTLPSGAIIPAFSYISQVVSSGVYLNNAVLGSGGATGTLTARSIVYPIYDNTRTSNSILSMTGLAIESSVYNAGWSIPNTNTWGTYMHYINYDVTSVENLIQQSRPIGVNTLVHQATFIPLNINLTIVYTPGSNQASVNSAISNALSSYLNQVPYLGVISFANILSQIVGIVGVNNVRVSSISIMSLDGTTIIGTSKNSDFLLASNQLPVLNTVNFTVKGMSNF